MQRITVQSTIRKEFVDITEQLRQEVRDAGWQNGVLLLFNPHTTAGLTINEGADPDVRRDILAALTRLVPDDGDYHHAEGNSDAHIKASLTGSSVLVPIQAGRLALGRWQSVFFCEYDGPRTRHVWLQFIADTQ
ncbi:MAG: YjbQ family protein [Acidobacteria bacterium]|nr:YjbQ family protein [Acidobacteriota bacterium]